MKTALIIPTCNAARHWAALCKAILRQSLRPDHILVIDSSSTDDTQAWARAAGFTVKRIARGEFSHGATRQSAATELPQAEVLIYLTQDAIPIGAESFRNIVSAFGDPTIGAAYGRQVPRLDATAIEAHARLFNYPPQSQIRSWSSRASLGFKSIFFSNSFGAYRRDALLSVGGFSARVSFGEDTLAVAHLHRAGWKSAYVAEALVEHSHAHSLQAEFQRYFAIGALHQQESWLLEQFGTANGEGRRFIVSELRYLLKHAPREIPAALAHSTVKFLAYHAGRRSRNPAPSERKREVAAKIRRA